MNQKVNYKAIILFFFIAVGCRFLTNKTDLFLTANPFVKTILSGTGPALGAIVVFFIYKIKTEVSLKGNYKNWITPLLIYWVLPILILSVVVFIKGGAFPGFTILIILVYGLLEEIGWRGFLYQHLKPFPLWLNILIVSLLWFVWHLNFELSTSNLIFFGILVIGSWGIGKVTDITKSLFAASAFHSLNNFFPEFGTSEILLLSILLSIWIVGIIVHKRINNLKTS